MLLLPATAGAQALKGSYFLDNSTNRNKNYDIKGLNNVGFKLGIAF